MSCDRCKVFEFIQHTSLPEVKLDIYVMFEPREFFFFFCDANVEHQKVVLQEFKYCLCN